MVSSIYPTSASPVRSVGQACGSFHVPILLYHRFDTNAVNAMTVTTETFESQLDYIRKNGYRIIPLRRLVDWYRGKAFETIIDPPGMVQPAGIRKGKSPGSRL